MTAFLFIPATVGNNGARRVDLANFASLFADLDEPVHRSNSMRKLLRIAAAVLLTLLAIGDTLLVTRPSAGTGLPAAPATSARAML